MGTLRAPLLLLALISCLHRVHPQRNRHTAHRLPQRFALEPQSRMATLGEKVVLACRVENKVGTLQWTRDGFGLGIDRNLSGFSRYSMFGNDEEDDYSLEIKNVTLDDDAVFQCQVGAQDGTRGVRSRYATLTVRVPPDPPKISPGKHIKTTAGMKVDLTCRADGGKPAADLTWFDGDDNKVEGPGLKKITEPHGDSKRENSVLTWSFNPSRHHDGQTFTCRADNPATSDSMKVTVVMEVRYPPEISLTVQNDKVQEFDTVKFQCDAHANPSDVTYRWYRNDEPLPINDNHKNSLSLERVNRKMNGETITCEVKNVIGTTKSTHTLNVYYRPQFKSEQAVVSAQLGTEVALNCEVDSNPKPDIVWMREGGPQVLGKQATYVIREMRPHDVGKYICRATVPGFPEITNEMMVYVKGPPRIGSPTLQYGMEGEEVHVECLIVSVPSATRVQWAKDGQLLDVDNNQGIEMIKEPLANGERNLLIIHHSTGDDFGEYNCSVWNAFGEHSLIISVRRHRNIATFIVMLGATSGAVVIVLLSIMIIFCVRRKPATQDFTNESKAKTLPNVTLNGDGVSADSELKVEIRTASSLSNMDRTVSQNGIETSWESPDHSPALPPYNSKVASNDYGDAPYSTSNANKGNSQQNNNGYNMAYSELMNSDYSLIIGGVPQGGLQSPIVANGALYSNGSVSNAALILPQYALNDLSAGSTTSPSECSTLRRNAFHLRHSAQSPQGAGCTSTLPYRKNNVTVATPDPISPQRYITATQNGHTVGQFKSSQLATHV